MASFFPAGSGAARRSGFAKRMSSHLAAALVVFALLQIFVVAATGGSLLLHLGIIVALAGFTVLARTLEHRWSILAESGLPRSQLAARFRADLIRLWSVGLLVPLLWFPIDRVADMLLG